MGNRNVCHCGKLKTNWQVLFISEDYNNSYGLQARWPERFCRPSARKTISIEVGNGLL